MKGIVYRLVAGFPLILALLICVSCNACNNNKNTGTDKRGEGEQSSQARPVSFYERNDGAARVIVFVHGIFGSSSDTWTCKDVSWPHLLKGDNAFNGSDIYVAGYSTPYRGNRMTIDEVVSNMKSRLDSDQVFSKHREVVFVVHSLGGLVIQRLLLTYRDLAKQVPFIYFYSTPETGAQVAKLGSIFSADPLLNEMFAGDSNDYLLNLENEWRGAAFPIHRYCAYEKQPFRGVMVVDRLSGTRGCQLAIAMNENHSTIVKPCDRNADSYIALRNAVIQNPIAPEKPQTMTVVEPRDWKSYQQVDCNRTNSQTLTASVTLNPQLDERVLSASASLQGADNIQGVTGPSLGAVTGNTVQVTYGFNGKDKDMFGNCPGGGHATVVVTFSVEKHVPVSH